LTELGAPTARSPEDWVAVFDALLKNDRVALAKVTSVITGFLARYRAYDLRDSWDDLIDEVLIRLIQSARRNSIREPRAFISYTGTITRNLLMDWIQRENKHRDLPDRIDVDVESRDPGVLLDLQRALDDLPEKERQVLEVIYLQGHSYESAAELLAIPLGTLKRRLTQARKEARKKMGQKGGSS
jgi:RNA polymerase sigma-70 factor (ECF subfamily)